MASLHGSSRHVVLATLALLLTCIAMAHVAEAAGNLKPENTASTKIPNRRLLSTEGRTRSLYDCDNCRVTVDNGGQCRESWEIGACCNSGDNADYCYLGGSSGTSCLYEFNDLYSVSQCCESCNKRN